VEVEKKSLQKCWMTLKMNDDAYDDDNDDGDHDRKGEKEATNEDS
jgi:hypothetical protein